MSDRKRKTVTLEPANYQELQDSDNASAVVNDLVDQWRRTGARDTAGLELQIDHKERELKEARQKVDRLEDELEDLRQMVDEFEATETEGLDEAREALRGTNLHPENPAVLNWSERLGLPPSELIDALLRT